MRATFHPYDGSPPSPITTFEFDGYAYGDRVLEGVMLVGTIKDGKLEVRFKDPDGIYEKSLNQDHWIRKVLDYAESDLEIGAEGGDVLLEV